MGMGWSYKGGVGLVVLGLNLVLGCKIIKGPDGRVINTRTNF